MVDLASNVAFALRVRAEETEARGRVLHLWDTLAGLATVENFASFYPAFTAGSVGISAEHQQRTVQITMDSLRHQLEDDDILIPAREIEGAAAAAVAMLDVLESQYQGRLDVDTTRRVLLGQVPEQIAELRVDDLHGELAIGLPSFYSASRNAYATEVADAINWMSSIVRFNGIALNAEPA